MVGSIIYLENDVWSWQILLIGFGLNFRKKFCWLNYFLKDVINSTSDFSSNTFFEFFIPCGWCYLAAWDIDPWFSSIFLIKSTNVFFSLIKTFLKIKDSKSFPFLSRQQRLVLSIFIHVKFHKCHQTNVYATLSKQCKACIVYLTKWIKSPFLKKSIPKCCPFFRELGCKALDLKNILVN